MNQSKGKQIAHGAVGTALTVVLMLMTVYLPVMAAAGVLLCGLPIVVLGTRYGVKVSAVVLAASTLLFGIVMGELLSALLLGVLYLLPGFAIGYAFSHRKGYFGALWYASAAVLIGFLLQLMVVNFTGDGNGIRDLADQTVAMVSETLSRMTASLDGAKQQELLQMMNGALQIAKEQFLLYIPTMLIAMAAAVGYVSVAAAIFMLKRLHIRQIPYLKFSGLAASRKVCYLSVILSTVVLFLQDSDSAFGAGILNLSMLLELFLAVCGFSFLDFKLGKKISSGYARAGIYAAVLVLGYALMGVAVRVLSLLGMIDGLFGFRYGEVEEQDGKEE